MRLIQTLRKRDKEHYPFPKSVQQWMPIRRIYADGIFFYGGRFSKTYRFSDINYAIASKEDQMSMFLKWCAVINALDVGAAIKLTLYNRRVNRVDYRYDAESHMLYVDRVVDRVDKALIEKLPKMEIKFRFPNLYPGTRTVIVLKQPKTEGSIRNVYMPGTVTQKLLALRGMQEKLKAELGTDGYMDYDLIICQANGRPIMTEHLNKRFKEVLVAMGDPDIDAEGIVFHSIRHTSAGVKLKLSKGDVKAVQGDGGWNTPDMVTKRYAHILDEDRRSLAVEMEAKFYQNGADVPPDPPVPAVSQKPEAEPAPSAVPALDENALASLIAANPNLLIKVLQSVQFANKG